VREGAVGVGKAPRQGEGSEPLTPQQHRRVTSMDLASGEWISLLLHGSCRSGGEDRRICERWGLPVGEDAERWCATAGDEERRRGKDESGAERSEACGSWFCFLLGERHMQQWVERSIWPSVRLNSSITIYIVQQFRRLVHIRSGVMCKFVVYVPRTWYINPHTAAPSILVPILTP
jgi:hypothetical protein